MKIEYNTKEQLTTEYKKAMKKFEGPIWTIKKDLDGDISFFKNGDYKQTLLNENGETTLNNLNNIAWKMAYAMGDLMSTKDRLDINIMGYSFYYYNCEDYDFWHHNSYENINDKIFKTYTIREEALTLIRNSQVIKDWRKEMREGK